VAGLAAPALRGVASLTQATVPAGKRVVALDRVFGSFWRTSDPRATQLPTVVGTNVWVRPDATDAIAVWDRQSAYFHVAYVLGMLAILVGLGGLLTLREPA
jgi:hypothetical protein